MIIVGNIVLQIFLDIGLFHYLLLLVVLFMIGVIGVLVWCNIIIIFMLIEFILNVVNINFVVLVYGMDDLLG